jgi:hypothetical protein
METARFAAAPFWRGSIAKARPLNRAQRYSAAIEKVEAFNAAAIGVRI